MKRRESVLTFQVAARVHVDCTQLHPRAGWAVIRGKQSKLWQSFTVIAAESECFFDQGRLYTSAGELHSLLRTHQQKGIVAVAVQAKHQGETLHRILAQ